MRIRRSMQARDLRSAPIDELDAFLLTLLVDAMSLSELLEIAPCDELETTQRVQNLLALSLLEDLEPRPTTYALSRFSLANDVREDAVTLRPPAPMQPTRRFDSDAVVTLRPPANRPLELDLDDFGDPPQTGVRPRPTAPGQPLARLKIMQRKP